MAFTKPLDFVLKIISLDDGVEAIFESLSTEVEYEGNIYPVQLTNVARTFQENFDPLAPDDIKFIEKAHIDLKEIIHEEILIYIL